MPLGNSSASNMASLPMATIIILNSSRMITLLAPFLHKPPQGSLSPEHSWSTSNPLSSIKSEPALIAHSSTPPHSSPENKTLPTTLQEDTTLSERKLLTSHWIKSGNSPTTALVSKDSWLPTPSVVEPAQDLVRYYFKDFQSITAKKPKWTSQFTHLPKYQQQLLSLTMRYWPLILYWSTRMSAWSWTMKPFTTFAEGTWTSNAQLTQIWTESSPKFTPHWLHLWDSMVHSMLTSPSSKPISSLTPGFISCYRHMLQLCLQKKHTIKNFLSKNSLLQSLNRPTWWQNAIQGMESTWRVRWCTGVMWCQRMSMLPFNPSRLNAPSSL